MTDYRTYLLGQLGLTYSSLSNADLERLFWASPPTGGGGASDASVAALVADPGSATSAALFAAYVHFDGTNLMQNGQPVAAGGGGVVLTDLGNGLASLTTSGNSSITDLGNGLAAVA